MRLSFRRWTTEGGWGSLSGMYGLPGILAEGRAETRSHINSLLPNFLLMWSNLSTSAADQKETSLSSVVMLWYTAFKTKQRFVSLTESEFLSDKGWKSRYLSTRSCMFGEWLWNLEFLNFGFSIRFIKWCQLLKEDCSRYIHGHKGGEKKENCKGK